VQALLADYSVEDHCALASVRQHVPVMLAAGCGTGATTPVVTVATDEAGWQSACAAHVRVTDTTPPVLVCPEAATLECTAPGGVPASDPRLGCWIQAADATDLCSDVSLTADPAPLLPASCDPAAVALVPFTALDGCGNATRVDCSLSILDSTGPELTGCDLAPAEPAAPGLPCSATSARAEVVCGRAVDACASEPVTRTAALHLSYWEVRERECVLIEEAFEVVCGEVIELRKLAPLCPDGPAGTPRAPTGLLPEGVRVFYGEAFERVVTGEDACGNTSSCARDASAFCLCAGAPGCAQPCGSGP
jgi:hypothetical protein